MKKIEKTGILALVAFLLLSGCSDSANEQEEQPVKAVKYEIVFTSLVNADYLGAKHLPETGDYLVTLTNGDGDMLELDLTSLKVSKPSAAMPEAGVYPVDNRKTGVLVSETSFWQTAKQGVETRAANMQPRKFAIRAGSLTTTPAASGNGTYTLSGTVTDGNITTLDFSWQGALSFDNESGESDPIVYETLFAVYGDFYGEDYIIPHNTYMMIAGSENVELRSRLRSSTPADASAPRPNDGEYTIDLRSDGKYANPEFSFRSGYLDGTSGEGTFWKADGELFFASSGSFTVSTVGSDWKIQGTIKDDAAGKEFSFTFTGTPNFRN